MPVPQRVREVEREIDEAIGGLPIWRARREPLLEKTLELYRDEVEVLLVRMACGDLEQLREFEERRRAGAFQVIKWAMEFGSESGDAVPDVLELQRLVELGICYEAFADALKLANYAAVVIEVDDATQTITVLEGGERTGQDANPISHQRRTLPFRPYPSFVADTDQLTLRWTAGDFRTTIRNLAPIAAREEREVITLAEGTPLISRPVICGVGDTWNRSEQAVVEDLTLSREKLLRDKWKLTCFSELPIIQVGPRRLAASNMLKTLAGWGDNYMPRIAARIDPRQYSRVSGSREGRMIQRCREALESDSWQVTPHYMLSAPSKEIDVFAQRGSVLLVLGLRSMLRPESPWEVKKRNDYVIEAIEHTVEVLGRFAPLPFGFVLTDGYCGDYATWEKAIAHGVGIGSIEDISDISRDPSTAFDLLKSRVGFNTADQIQPLPDCQCELAGWHLRLVDAQR